MKKTSDMRIGQFLSHAGVCSRRASSTFLRENEVIYQDERITRPDIRVDLNGPDVIINGKKITVKKREILLLNKPPGYVCTHKEQKNQKSFFRLLPPVYSSFFFAGRLDIDSRGLMVLSNDGQFIYELSHPSGEQKKIYHVHTSRPLASQEKNEIVKGFFIQGEFLKADQIEPLDMPSHYKFVLHHGKNREIRRLLEKFSVETLDLFRVQFADFSVEGIQEGEYRSVDS